MGRCLAYIKNLLVKGFAHNCKKIIVVELQIRPWLLMHSLAFEQKQTKV